MSRQVALKRELQKLTHKAVTTRQNHAKMNALIGMLPVMQALIQGMTDGRVELSFKVDGEEMVPQAEPPPPPTPPLKGGEHLIVNEEGRYEEVPAEADNYQLPRDVLAALYTLQSVVNARGLHMLTAVCGFSEERQKWTGTVMGTHTPESIPYLVAGIRDTLKAEAAGG